MYVNVLNVCPKRTYMFNKVYGHTASYQDRQLRPIKLIRLRPIYQCDLKLKLCPFHAPNFHLLQIGKIKFGVLVKIREISNNQWIVMNTDVVTMLTKWTFLTQIIIAIHFFTYFWSWIVCFQKKRWKTGFCIFRFLYFEFFRERPWPYKCCWAHKQTYLKNLNQF